MRPPKIVRPTEELNLKHSKVVYVLDMRVTSKQGKDLAELINDSFDHTQLFVESPMPSKLIVTQKQFASLNNFTEEMYQTTDRMFMTGNGYVLEVQVDREIDTVDEIEEVMEDTEQMRKEMEADDEQDTTERIN